MTYPAIRAHLRLLQQLPVRTVLRDPDRIGSGTAHKHGQKPVEVRGKTFPTKVLARRHLHVSFKTLDAMLATGEARYV